MSNQTNLSHSQRTMISRIPEVVTRKARYSYGILCDKAIATLTDYDRLLDKVKLDPEGVQVAPRMDWYLNKGDEVSKKSPKLIGYQQFAKAANVPEKCVFIIRYSQSDPPPKRQDASVAELCRIECEWDRPFSEWKVIGGSGSGWRKHDDLTLAMRFGGQPKWTIKVGANETEHDVKVEYSS